MKQLLFNPFTRIAGSKALIYGWLAILLTAVIANWSNFHIDAELHMGPGAPAPFEVFVIESLLAWVCTVIFFYFVAIAFSKSRVRFLDIAGTTALARWPLVFVAILSFIPVSDNVDAILKRDPAIILPLLLVGLLSLPFIILFVVLLYNAYAVSANLKGGKAVWTFILAMLLSDIAARIVFHFLSQIF